MAKRKRIVAMEQSQGRSWEFHAVFGAVLLGLVVLLTFAFASAAASHDDTVQLATQALAGAGNDAARTDRILHHLAVAGHAQDMLFLRGVALLLAFVIIVVGCVFVQRGCLAHVMLSRRGGGAPSTLRAAAPGLLLILLAGVLIAIVFLTSYAPETPVARRSV